MTQRSRPRFIYLTVYGIVMLMLIPYPTTECPPIAISLVDQNDAPIAGIRAVCRGGFYADYFQSEVKFDQRGQLILPAHRVWLSGVQRILEVAGSMLPHGGGFRSASADVSFAFPTGAARLDAAKMNAKLRWDSGGGPARTREWVLSGGWTVGSQENIDGNDSFFLTTNTPSSAPQADFRIPIHLNDSKE
jgi:hypothetical protein